MSLAPDGLAHGLRHDGIVAGGKGERRAGKLGLRPALIPVQQPAKPLVEPLDIESLRGSEGLGAAAAPEGLKGLAWIAAKPAPHAGDPRRRNVRTEAVEALDADQAAEGRCLLLPCPVKQPEQPEGVADSDGVARPGGRGLRSTGYESEVDERDLCIPDIARSHRARSRG